ncbi:MAG TPA: metallophosphoesterase family protein [Phototrophicaceae bacterium]|jgi:putative phosphoesterase|nr:metallophosphoesterase family protein [Phototrophicaceae bacterium]
MKIAIAIISDIQGNALALETALDQIYSERPDLIVSLGDVASGPEPVAVVELLRQYRCLTVRGNMDDVILNPVPYTGDDETSRNYAEMDLWCSTQLSDVDREFLNSFQPHIAIEMGQSKTLLCFHGSPQSYDDVIESQTPDDVLAQLFTGYSATVMATGHMHRPMLRHFQNMRLLNPGSIGLPGGGHTLMRPIAEFALVIATDNALTVSFCSVEYDAQEFQRRVLASGMPHSAWYLTKWRL